MLDIRSNPESLLVSEQTRRLVRFEVQGLPLVEGFVIRNLYGIGCDPVSYTDLARELGSTVDSVSLTESLALSRLSRVMSKF